jgi:hypothetical protein
MSGCQPHVCFRLNWLKNRELNLVALAGLEPAIQGLGILFQASCGTGEKHIFPYVSLFSI